MAHAIRPATDADYEAFARLFRELEIDDPTPDRERWTTGLGPDSHVCEHEGVVVGFVSAYTTETAGHVRMLAVAPEARRAGVGRALMRVAAAKLRERGVAEWHLNVKAENRAAIRLYESLGMVVSHRMTSLRLAWDDVARLPDAGSATVRAVAPDEDPELEAAFGLFAGRLAAARVRPGRAVLQLRDAGGRAAGLAVFDPALPGAYPFCAQLGRAAALLRALQPMAEPGHAAVYLIVEAAPALVKLLVGVGASVQLELLHYRGTLG